MVSGHGVVRSTYSSRAAMPLAILLVVGMFSQAHCIGVGFNTHRSNTLSAGWISSDTLTSMFSSSQHLQANPSAITGPSTETDAFWRTTKGHALQRADYSDDFHLFGLVWNKDYIYTYIDSVLAVSHSEPVACRI